MPPSTYHVAVGVHVRLTGMEGYHFFEIRSPPPPPPPPPPLLLQEASTTAVSVARCCRYERSTDAHIWYTEKFINL